MHTTSTLLGAVLIVIVGASAVPAAAPQQQHRHDPGVRALASQLLTPEPLRVEHDRLHEGLAAAIRAGGETAAAAEAVHEAMRPHFVREEQIAMPPLALLKPLADGEFSPSMKAALPMTRALRAEMTQMLEEHEQIKAALERLARVARAEGQPEHERFAELLILHARTEEEILYPAALLVGRVLEEHFAATP